MWYFFHMDFESGISRQLKRLRKQRNLTQNELADIIGIGQTAIANYENGKRFPDEKNLVKIADYFETSIDRLIGRNFRPSEPIIKKQSGFNYTPSGLEEKAGEYLTKSLQSGSKGIDLILELLNRGYTEEQIMLDLLEASLQKTGDLWAEGQYNEAMEHQISSAVIQSIMMLQTYFKTGPGSRGSLVALTAAGEQHNIGLRMIARFLEIDGWQSYFLGSSVPARSLKEFIKTNKINLVLISVTLNENTDSACSLIKAAKSCIKPPVVIAGGSASIRNSEQLLDAGADYQEINAVKIVEYSRNIKT